MHIFSFSEFLNEKELIEQLPTKYYRRGSSKGQLGDFYASGENFSNRYDYSLELDLDKDSYIYINNSSNNEQELGEIFFNKFLPIGIKKEYKKDIDKFPMDYYYRGYDFITAYLLIKHSISFAITKGDKDWYDFELLSVKNFNKIEITKNFIDLLSKLDLLKTWKNILPSLIKDLDSIDSMKVLKQNLSNSDILNNI
jgi:hypothetical protein